MPRTITTTVYEIHELENTAKAKAREWYIHNVLDRTNWHETVFNDFETVCGILGITLQTRPATRTVRGTASPPRSCIWFTGFWSQGDGACFEGAWEHSTGCAGRLRRYAPLDKDLHRICDALNAAQRPNFYQLQATITQHGRYYHEHSMRIDVERNHKNGLEPTEGASKSVSDAMRDLARWLYRSLQEDYESQTSDDAIDETIEANEWLFTAEGEHFAA
ncbi:MAG: antitoxin of toxin-antitoxin stability system [Acidobacteria bacterium]|nr:antitoxin of toxin-antitoxin stability system [Acidobacteriota bacterium]